MPRKIQQKPTRLTRKLGSNTDQSFSIVQHTLPQHQAMFEVQRKDSDVGIRQSSGSPQHDLQQVFLQQTLELYHFTSAIYVTLTEQGKIERANLPFCDLFGIHLNLLSQYYLSHIVAPIDHSRLSVFLREVIKLRRKLSSRFSLKKKDGTIFPAQIESFPFNDQVAAHHQYHFLIRVLNEQTGMTTHGQQSRFLPGHEMFAPSDDQSEYPRRLRQVTRKLILSEHHQRKQFASQLHDFLGPRLTLCGFKVNQLRQQTDKDAHHLAGEALALLDEALVYTRMLITDLHCPVLADLGLCEGLRWLAERMRDFGIHVTLRVPKRPLNLPETIDVLIFEAVRELLVNVRKHAKVQDAMVSVKMKKSHILSVIVSDKGIGTNVGSLWKNTQKNPCYGLSTIRERLLAFQGELTLKSRPKQGMVATISIPNIPQ